MRTLTLYLAAAIILVAFMAAPASAQTAPKAPATPWFDMAHCEMCKPLTEYPGLVQNMTWEQHDIANGIVSVTTVREPFMKQYREAQTKMADVAKRMQQGENVQLCQSCTEFGQCVMKGAKVEDVQTKHGDVMIVTSDKPELVAELQSWAKRSNEEMMKMEATQKSMKEGEMKKEGEQKMMKKTTDKKQG